LSRRKTFTFQSRDMAAGGGLAYQKICPLSKGFWFDGFLRVEPGSVGVALAEGLRDWGGGPCPFWLKPWNLPYNWGKARKTSVRVAEQPQDYSLAPTWLSFEGQPRLACWSSVHLGYSSQPLVGASAFQVAVLRGSPQQLTSSRNSRSVLWYVRRKMQSPNPREFACFQRTKVR
jgi:hypothetical protein